VKQIRGKMPAGLQDASDVAGIVNAVPGRYFKPL
jgi:hypothetical protein